jgi:hypothetical protein
MMIGLRVSGVRRLIPGTFNIAHRFF